MMRVRTGARTLALLVLAGLTAACATASRPAPDAAATPPATATPAAGEDDRSSFQAALDRLGVPLDLPDEGKAIVVNIPAFELVAFEDAEPVLESRVIVGTPHNPTPVLATHTTAVRFRPTWRPTPAMLASGEYEDRVWPPGENNPLGLAAIRLEEGLLIYLHDTNQPALFEREQRALSHGCIRVDRWRALVAWVLDTSPARVERLARGGKTVDVPTPPIPVHLAYLTVFPEGDGGVERHADIYDRPDAVPEVEPAAATAAEPAAACAPLADEPATAPTPLRP
jgi:murein L,D-transpeptidase YcbB/YkuD